MGLMEMAELSDARDSMIAAGQRLAINAELKHKLVSKEYKPIEPLVSIWEPGEMFDYVTLADPEARRLMRSLKGLR